MSVFSQAKRSRLEALQAMRDALAKEIDLGGGTVPQCVSQLRGVMKEIEELQEDKTSAKPGPSTPLTQFEERLNARNTSAKATSKKRRSG